MRDMKLKLDSGLEANIQFNGDEAPQIELCVPSYTKIRIGYEELAEILEVIDAVEVDIEDLFP